MRFGLLTRVLVRNKISWNLKITVRILFLFQSSVWSSIFAAVEHLRFHRKLKSFSGPRDPVFIIGHWRTGTSFLFKLMSLDDQFTAPTLFQVAEPDSLLTSHSYYKPIMKALVKGTRPMDNVRMGVDEPQEDEYAIYRLTGDSPLEQLVFPSSGSYFLERWVEKMPRSGTNLELKKKIRDFFIKIQFHKSGKLLSKNPFHSFRILMLREIFPEARFIQIHRHPFNVVPSAINMWNILQRENALNNDLHNHEVAEVCRVMKTLNERIIADTETLPAGVYTETRFEDLEKDPVKIIRQIYSALGLTFSDRFEVKIIEYIEFNRNFRKNIFSLSEGDKSLILSELKDYMGKHSYS